VPDPGAVVKRSSSLSGEALHDFFLTAKSACRSDANALGWLPWAAYLNAHGTGRVDVVVNSDDVVGYTIVGDSRGELRIYHCWVRADARMILHGRLLVEAAEARARQAHAWAIGLWCAEDLAANLFWKAVGFERVNWRWGKGKKRRRHIQWRRLVAPTTNTPLVEQTPQSSLNE
jgi:GNAT superfamily N-acetyltransferase